MFERTIDIHVVKDWRKMTRARSIMNMLIAVSYSKVARKHMEVSKSGVGHCAINTFL